MNQDQYDVKKSELAEQQDYLTSEYLKNRSNLEFEYNDKTDEIKNKITANLDEYSEYKKIGDGYINGLLEIQNKIENFVEADYEYSAGKVNDMYQNEIQNYLNKDEQLNQELSDLKIKYENDDDKLTNNYNKSMKKFDDRLEDLKREFNE